MLDDTWFPDGAWSVIRDELRIGLESFGGIITALYGRGWCGAFVRRAKGYFPAAADELERAAAVYDRIMGGPEGLTPQIFCPDPSSDEVVQKYAHPDRREHNAAVLMRIADLDSEAIGHIRAALVTINDQKWRVSAGDGREGAPG